MRKGIYSMLCILMLIGLLAACSTDTGVQESSSEELMVERIVELQSQMSKLEKQIEALNQQIEVQDNLLVKADIERSLMIDMLKGLEHSSSIYGTIVRHLPEIGHKSGYITDISLQDNTYFIQFNYIEMLHGEEAIQEVMTRDNVPREEVALGSGFLLKEYPGRTYRYPLSTKSIIYKIDPVYPAYLPLEDFLEYVHISTYPRLYNFTIIEDQIVVIQEQYLP